MIKSTSINSLIGPEVFKKCLVQAMRSYGVNKAGLNQKDLLPTGASLVKSMLRRAGVSKRDGVWVCVNGLRRGRGRIDVKNEIKKFAKVDPYECMVDIYCCIGQKDPYKPLITMECEGAAWNSGEVKRSATSDDCDYLWDLFKLLQVPSPLRVFLALCAENKVADLQWLIDRNVKAYSGLRKPKDVVYAVVIPWATLKGKSITIQRWSGNKSTCDILQL